MCVKELEMRTEGPNRRTGLRNLRAAPGQAFIPFLLRKGAIDTTRNSGRNVPWRLVREKLGGSMRWRMGVQRNRIQAVRSPIMLPGKLRCLEVLKYTPKPERRTLNVEEAEVGTRARTPRQS